MKNKFLSLVALCVLASFGWLSSSGAVNDHQILICHATGNEGHYSTPTPTKQQIFNDNGHNSGGGVHPGDIIPPFAAGEHGGQSWGDFPGLNWDAEGQAIYNNGCVVPVVETTTTSTTVPETTTSTTAPSTTTTVPETTTTTSPPVPPTVVEQGGPGSPVPVSLETEEADELADTGLMGNAGLALVAMGLALTGSGFMLLSDSYKKEVVPNK